MKRIKIILGIISGLTLIFFTTGLFVKETNYTTIVQVNKPLENVFETFNQIEDIKNWIPEVKTVNVITKSLGKTGSIYKIIIDANDQEITMTQKIVAYVPNEKVTVFYDAENMLKTNDYIFEEKNGVSKITLNSTCRSDSYIMACTFPYFKGTFKAQDQSYLNNFKSYIEQK
ncbi:MAG: SRPBCC family protein [Polaribacter sp.]|nr:SRPBCC family protein [Polaribacter sp.]